MVAAVIVEVTTDVAAANSRDTVTDVTCNERAFRLGWGFLSFSGRGGCRDKRPCEKADSGVYVPRAYHATVVLTAMDDDDDECGSTRDDDHRPGPYAEPRDRDPSTSIGSVGTWGPRELLIANPREAITINNSQSNLIGMTRTWNVLLL